MSDIEDEKDYKYALKCILYNDHGVFDTHMDVMAVMESSGPSGILTGSRDNTLKLWVPDDKIYKEDKIFMGPKISVICLCWIPESPRYPAGLILVGTADPVIYAFSLSNPRCCRLLYFHTGAVCTITTAEDLFVSGSQDKTVIVWDSNTINIKAILWGHTGTIRAIAIYSESCSAPLPTILTGSEDNSIRLWLPDGSRDYYVKVYLGHEDCVTGLTIISSTTFASCSNDTNVRIWHITGECITTLIGNVCAITSLHNNADFATCGTERTIRIWRHNDVVQTLFVDCKSLRNITCLSNGDIAVGTSDGKVFVLEKVATDYFDRLAVMSEAELDEDAAFNFSRNPELSIQLATFDGEQVVFYETGSKYMYVCKYNQEWGTAVYKQEMCLQYIQKTFYKEYLIETTSEGVYIHLREDEDVAGYRYAFFQRYELVRELAAKRQALDEAKLKNKKILNVAPQVCEGSFPVTLTPIEIADIRAEREQQKQGREQQKQEREQRKQQNKERAEQNKENQAKRPRKHVPPRF